MKSKISRNSMIVGICLVAAVFIVTQGQGCSGQVASTTNAGNQNSSSSGNNGNTSNNNGGLGIEPLPSDDIPVLPNSKTVSVVYSKQILEQFSTCLGVQPSDRSSAMYENKKGSISISGTASTITSPMMMAVMSIAGEICQDLVLQENPLATKRIFTNFNLDANQIPSESVIKDSISRLALSCWQRRETTVESQNLVSMVSDSIGATENQASRKAALMLCTSMLSSLDALVN